MHFESESCEVLVDEVQASCELVSVFKGKGKKDSRTECVFFPPPGFLRRKLNLSTKKKEEKENVSTK